VAENISKSFENIKDRALAAFDKITAGYVSPARKLLDANAKAHEELLRQEERQAIERRIAEATTEEERQAALRDMREFEFAEQQRALEAQAAAEEEHWTKTRAKERNQLEQRLKQFFNHLTSKKATAKKLLAELSDIFADFGLKNGDAYMGGLGKMMDKLRKQLQEMGALVGGTGGGGGGGGGGVPAGQVQIAPGVTGVADIGPKGATPTTFMWGGIEWGRSVGRGKAMFTNYIGGAAKYATWAAAHPGAAALLAQGGIITRPTLAMMGERGPEAVIPLSQAGAGMGLGDIVVNIVVHGSIWQERDVARSIRDELIASLRQQNPRVGLA
jgi:hypothetical protein